MSGTILAIYTSRSGEEGPLRTIHQLRASVNISPPKERRYLQNKGTTCLFAKNNFSGKN